ncbi:MAG: hypothetical protein GY861_05630 [bacterium]|nr:hypothetical protein [bacterium]
MPTGYTAVIKDGISFKDFVMRCSRAMGALITMRDDPLDKPIPERFEPSSYYLNNYNEAKTRLQKLKAMSSKEVGQKALKNYQDEKRRHAKRVKDNAEQIEKYKAMLDKVQSWEPPTSEHNGLKEFMVEQLKSSINFDDTRGYDVTPTKIDSQIWLHDEIRKVIKNIEYYAEEYKKELERVESRNIWVKQLIESLN